MDMFVVGLSEFFEALALGVVAWSGADQTFYRLFVSVGDGAWDDVDVCGFEVFDSGSKLAIGLTFSIFFLLFELSLRSQKADMRREVELAFDGIKNWDAFVTSGVVPEGVDLEQNDLHDLLDHIKEERETLVGGALSLKGSAVLILNLLTVCNGFTLYISLVWFLGLCYLTMCVQCLRDKLDELNLIPKEPSIERNRELFLNVDQDMFLISFFIFASDIVFVCAAVFVTGRSPWLFLELLPFPLLFLWSIFT